jgi:diacylglycerol kinase
MRHMAARAPRSTFASAVRAAARGIAGTFRDEPNFRYQIMAGLAAVSLSVWLEAGTALVLLCCALVLTSELFNSALENLSDALHPERHPLVAAAKDAAAGAVLVSAIVSVLVGLAAMGPALLERLRGL